MWDILYRHDGEFFTTVESNDALNKALDLGFVAYRRYTLGVAKQENILFREESTGELVSVWAMTPQDADSLGLGPVTTLGSA